MWWVGMPVDTECPQLRAIQDALNKQWLAQQRLAPKAAVDSRRRWEARWEAREARGKAARARKLAAQDQGSKTGPTQAGPCAACDRQGGICGFCRERQRLAYASVHACLATVAGADGSGRRRGQIYGQCEFRGEATFCSCSP